MLGAEVIHKGKLSIVLNVTGDKSGAPILAIQNLSPNGLIYPVKQRPKGFKQYIFVRANEVCGVDS